jgi:methylation protein EvaC
MNQKNTFKTVGEYKYFDLCRFCASGNLQTVIDLGLMPLAGGFLRNLKEQNQEKYYPLQLNFCNNCFLLQSNSSISPDILFKNYFYFSTSIKTLVKHFENISSALPKILPDPKDRFVVEIGANDGAFIKTLQRIGYKTLGIDPAINVVRSAVKKNLPILNDYFTQKTALKIVKKYGKADAIYSFHSMAHIENMHDVMRGIKKLLREKGFLAMEVHYLKRLINELQYDMIYHEHQFYYSYLSLRNFFKQYDMEIFDAQEYDIRAGSIMFYVQNNKGGRKITDGVKKLMNKELISKLNYYFEKSNF